MSEHYNYSKTSFDDELDIQERNIKAKTYRRDTSIKSKRKGGKMARTMMVCSVIQKGFVANNTSHMTMTYYDMIDKMSSKIIGRLPLFISEITNEFLVAELKDSMINVIMKYFKCSDRIAVETMSLMKRVGFMKKHDNRTYSFNPYVIGDRHIATWKLYQLQCHWELSNEPMTEWEPIDEEEEWAEVESTLQRAMDEVKEKITYVKMEKEDIENLKSANKDDTISTLRHFWEYYYKEIYNTKKRNNEKTYETLSDYIKSEEGIRHLRNWWISEGSSKHRREVGGVDLMFTYRKRGEYRKYFLQIIEEYSSEEKQDRDD